MNNEARLQNRNLVGATVNAPGAERANRSKWIIALLVIIIALRLLSGGGNSQTEHPQHSIIVLSTDATAREALIPETQAVSSRNDDDDDAGGGAPKFVVVSLPEPANKRLSDVIATKETTPQTPSQNSMGLVASMVSLLKT